MVNCEPEVLKVAVPWVTVPPVGLAQPAIWPGPQASSSQTAIDAGRIEHIKAYFMTILTLKNSISHAAAYLFKVTFGLKLELRRQRKIKERMIWRREGGAQ